MLLVYLIALALGGTFVIASLLLGGDTDSDLAAELDSDIDVGSADIDSDIDGDMGADGDADNHVGDHGGGGGMDAVMAWLPFASLRFWTFFLAFFGLTGTVLTAFGLLAGALWIAAIATGVGYMTGWTVVTVVGHLSRNQGDSTVSEDDYMGANGTVMVPVASDRVGKVRLDIKGRTVELLARTEDESPIGIKQTVMIYGTSGDYVLVTRAA